MICILSKRRYLQILDRLIERMSQAYSKMITICLGAAFLLPLAASMPMEASKHSQSTVNDNSWWVTALDQALGQPSFTSTESISSQFKNYDRSSPYLNQVDYAPYEHSHDPALPWGETTSADLPHSAIDDRFHVLGAVLDADIPSRNYKPAALGDINQYSIAIQKPPGHVSGDSQPVYYGDNSNDQYHSFNPENFGSLPSHGLQEFSGLHQALPNEGSAVLSENRINAAQFDYQSRQDDSRWTPSPTRMKFPDLSVETSALNRDVLIDRSGIVSAHADRRYSDPPSAIQSDTQLNNDGEPIVFESLEVPRTSRPIKEARVRAKKARLLVAASKFLQHHPQFEERPKDSSTESAQDVWPEFSPESRPFKKAVNEHLFNNRLIWKTKGDDMLNDPYDVQFRQFIQRLNTRKSWLVTNKAANVEGLQLQGRIFASQHRSYANGNSMFDPEPDQRSLLFTFWTPSNDDLRARLQFIGSGSLSTHDAGEVISHAQTLKSGPHEDAGYVVGPRLTQPSRLQIAPPRRNVPSSITGLYGSSNDWLKNLPVVAQILPENSAARKEISQNLVSSVHRQAKYIQRAANLILFGGEVTWQHKPEEVMLSAKMPGTVGVFRYHKHSKTLYMTRPEILARVPYRMVLIPYEAQSARTRLFDVSISGHAHAFTLWAAHDVPGSRYAETFQFVSGGALIKEKSGIVLQKAISTMQQLSGVSFHQL